MLSLRFRADPVADRQATGRADGKAWSRKSFGLPDRRRRSACRHPSRLKPSSYLSAHIGGITPSLPKRTAPVCTYNSIRDNRPTLIRNLLEGQYENPVRIVAFNTAEGWSRDVTADIADEIRRRYVEYAEVPTSVLRFLEKATRH
jgi:hypothetical protein